MQNVSTLFKDSCESNLIDSTFKIFVSKGKSGEVLAVLGVDDFFSDSATIEKQSSNSNVFTIGGVCASKFSFNLKKSGINKLKEANCFRKNYCLTVIQWNKVEDENQSIDDYSLNIDGSENETGKCKLGVYYIATINNKDYSCIVEAYDGMLAYEVVIPKAKLLYMSQNYKSIDDWIAWVNDECITEYYDLTYKGSKGELVTGLFQISDDTEIGTYRDFLGYLSQLSAGFMTFDCDGELFYSCLTLDEPDGVIDVNRVLTYDFDSVESFISEFTTSIAGLDYSKAVATVESKNNIKLSIQENLLLRGIQQSETELDEQVLSVLDFIAEKTCRYKFFGCDISIIQHPYIDLGDMLEVHHIIVDNEGAIQTEVKNNVIANSIVYKLGSEITIKSYSSVTDTTISSQSKVIGPRGSGGNGGGNAFLHYLGAKDVRLSAGQEVQIFKEYVIIGAEFPCTIALTAMANVTKSGVFYFDIYYDGILQLLNPVYTPSLGYQTFSFTLGFDATDKYEVHTVMIKMRSVDCMLEMPAFNSQLIVMASGVKSGSASWTGLYELEDIIERIDAKSVVHIRKIKDNVVSTIQKPIGGTLTDRINRINALGLIKVRNLISSINYEPLYERLLYRVLSTDFARQGSASITADSNAESGYYLKVGTYSSNIAAYTFSITDNIEQKVIIRGRMKNTNAKITVLIDDKVIIEDAPINQSGYSIILLCELNGLSAGNHSLVLSSSGTSPYIDYIDAIIVNKTVFYKTHIFSAKSSEYDYDMSDVIFVDNNRFNLSDNKVYEDVVESQLDSKYLYTIPYHSDDFVSVSDFVLEVNKSE